RVTPSPSYASRLRVPREGGARPGLCLLLALRGSGRTFPTGVRIHGTAPVLGDGLPPHRGGGGLLRRGGERPAPPAGRTPSGDRRPLVSIPSRIPGSLNFEGAALVRTFNKDGPCKPPIRAPKGSDSR